MISRRAALMSVNGTLTSLCQEGARLLPASDLGVSVLSVRGEPAVVAASSQRGEEIEQLQFTLGEGPCRDACELGRPVLTPDLRLAARERWPGYAPAVLDLGVGAVFAFPLQRGASRLGALDVYREQPGSLSEQAFVQALEVAERATASLLDEQAMTERQGRGTEGEAILDRVFVVYQAQGMVQVQLGVDLAEALGRLRAYAYAHDRPLNEVAADVVARRLLLEQDS